VSAVADAAPATPADAAEVVLSVRDLAVSYDTTTGPAPVLYDVGFDVRAGRMLGVIGESGSGKSTLGRAVLGMLPHGGMVTAGRADLVETPGSAPVDLLGVGSKRLRVLRGSSVALVPQATSSALHPVKKVGAQFAQTYRAHGLKDSKQQHALARQALEDVGMQDPEHVLGLYPFELSGGMAQRVVVALAAALGPRVLVADEPTSALDVTVQRRLLDNLSKTIREGGRGCLFVTHDLGVVSHYCDDVLVLYGGCVVESGPVEAIMTRPAHPFTARLLDTVPGAHRRRRKSTVEESQAPAPIPGTVCPYSGVCGATADPRCLTGMPPWRAVGPGHAVRAFCAPVRDAGCE